MRLRRLKRSQFEDSSASSDIAFLLIIYFIVIAGFNVNKGFLMDMPAKDSTRLLLREELLRFEMDDTGALLYDERPLAMADAEIMIRSNLAEMPNLAVVLVIAPAAPWQSVVSFVELAQKLDVDSFSFSMRQP
ncbi:MAG: biopolymer transporter ExbD [Treponema sp.]|jgi:biopolymer transport protein ExbD|nr:biopolymer transporter ExbD [Treponema sp.]